MIKYTTEYLILHEDEVDWDKISSDKDDFLSLIEVRLFRRKINWEKYLISHKNQLSDDILEIASKYFRNTTYELLISFNICSEAFLEKHIEDVKDKFKSIIENCNVSEDFLLRYKCYWENLPNIFKIFNNSRYIDLKDSNYKNLSLVLEVL